jgi:DNA-binding winged helix-turn-helix (wHTH) protein
MEIPIGEQVSEPAPTNPKSIFRFGLYELDGGTGELRKEGKLRPRLQGQPLDVLLHLLAHRGDVVTRDELRLLLWPTDTFVDYDHSLNTAVNKLREALNDSADNSRFIQTIPRRGYRFIASVEVVGDGASGSAGPKQTNSIGTEASPAVSSENRNFMLSDAHDLPDAPRGVIQFLFSLIQVMYLFFYVISLARLRWMEPLLSQAVQHPKWIFTLLLVTALIGIPLRLYLLSAAIFGYRRLPVKFLRLFPFVILLDELWALAPFLLVDEIGVGLALAATAALLYLPFSQRSLMLMGEFNPKRAGNI